MKYIDEQIQRELDARSNEQLPPEDRILSKARAEMRRRAQSTPQKKKTGWTVWLCSAAAAAVIAVIVAIGVFGNFGMPSPPSGNSSFTPSPDIESPTVSGFYSAGTLSASNIDYARASAVYTPLTGLPLPLPEDGVFADGTRIISEKFTLYRDGDSGKEMLLQCSFRAVSDSGYDDVTLWLELTNAVYEGNRDYLNLPKGDDVKYVQTRENGEYVSLAYLQNKYGCMLSVMNPSQYGLNRYLSLLFGVTEEGAK